MKKCVYETPETLALDCIAGEGLLTQSLEDWEVIEVPGEEFE